MLFIPFIVSFIIGWRTKQFGLRHAIGLAVFSVMYAIYAVDAYARRVSLGGYDPSQIHSFGNYVYAFGYAAIGCGGLMFLAAWWSSRRRMKRALKEQDQD